MVDIIAVKQRLMREEGFRSAVYKDHLGYYTIGFGRMVDKRKGGGITKQEAGVLLMNDCRDVEEGLTREFPWWVNMPEPAQQALFDMTFNMGLTKMKDGWPNTMAAMKAGDWDSVIANITGSLYAQQVTNRAQRNIALFREAKEEDCND